MSGDWSSDVCSSDLFPSHDTGFQIQNETNKEIFSDAIAVLSTKDKYFIKDVGRKISMKKAMNAIGLNKETRKLFWIEYHKMTNKLNKQNENRSN